VIGPYKLLEQIGEGGFGVVFLAEQTEPVRRKVALKIIKPGMDTRQVIGRFEAERQALAMMDHPNIAKVFDAGTTSVDRSLRERESGSRSEPPTLDAGRPYFVMELVQGIPITDYCDQCNLTTHERLELFTTVCHAVQHAHQKGVIHRDIKPTNVLVAMQDGRPCPKIIDFGVAKAIGEQSLTEHTLTAGFAQMIGTPLYMSPEQAELSPLGVDTRSDIYSLGVLLYELLAGTTPFDKERLHSASYDELRRIIREEEPPRPSARLSSLSLRSKTRRGEERAGVRVSRSGEPSRTSSDSLPLEGRAGEGVSAAETAALTTTIATHRRTDPRRLIQSIRGELDWIVMKCLEKDRNRRYETANGLLRDVERFLADEPVEARPVSAAYRLRKFYRRNRLVVTAAGFVVASLLAGITGATWGLVRATKAEALAQNRFEESETLRQQAITERNKAEQERNYSQAIADFVVEDFLALTSIEGQEHFGGESSAALHKDTTVRELLDRAAEKLQERRDLEPQIEGQLRWIIGANYRGIGEFDRAITFLERSVELWRQELGDEHVKTLSARDILAGAYNDAGQVRKAVAQSEQSANVAVKKFGPDDWFSLTLLGNLANLYEDAGKWEEAIALQEQVKVAKIKQLGPEHPDTLDTLNNLASAYSTAGRTAEAIALFEQVRDVRLKKFGADHSNTLKTLNNLAGAYAEAGRLSEAIALYEQVKEMEISKLGLDHPDTLGTLYSLAMTYRNAGNVPLAIALFEQVKEAQSRKLGPDHPDTHKTLIGLVLSYQDTGRLPDSIALLEEARDAQKKSLGAENPLTLITLAYLAEAYSEAGRTAEAIALIEQVREATQKVLSPDDPEADLILSNLAVAYWRTEQLDKSIPLFESKLQQKEKKLGRGHPDTLISVANLGVNYKDADRIAEAIPLLEEAHAAAKEYPTLSWVAEPLFESYIEAGRSEDAIRLSTEMLADFRRTQPQDSLELARELAYLGSRLLKAKAYDKSEPLLRECLTLRESLAKAAVDDDTSQAVRPWHVAGTKSFLGSALVGQAESVGDRQARDKLLAEAEPLLIDGWEGLKAAADLALVNPADPDALHEASRVVLTDTLDRLIELYSAINKPDAVNKWEAEKAKLATRSAHDQKSEAVENKEKSSSGVVE
jgi:serine/threonine protein kinase